VLVWKLKGAYAAEFSEAAFLAAVSGSGTLCVFAHSSGSATGTFKAYVFARGAGSFDGQAAVAEVSVTAAKKSVGVSCRATHSGLQGDFTSTLQVCLPLARPLAAPHACALVTRAHHAGTAGWSGRSASPLGISSSHPYCKVVCCSVTTFAILAASCLPRIFTVRIVVQTQTRLGTALRTQLKCFALRCVGGGGCLCRCRHRR